MRVWLTGNSLMAVFRVTVLGALAKLYLIVPAALATTINPFQGTYVELPPPNEIYDEGACFTSLVVPLDLNYDGRQDLLVHYFCNDFNGEVAPAPTLNALMVYISESDGTFSVGNKEIFGADKISLGGATRNYARGDFNNDGKPDIVFAVNWEDGRPQGDSFAWDTEQTIILSSASGYSLERVGNPIYGHGVGVLNNGLGYQDILTTGRNDWGGVDMAVLRWQANKAVYVTQSYPKIEAGLALGGVPFDSDEKTGGIYNATDDGGIDYFTKSSGSWVEYNSAGLDRLIYDSATWVTWNGDPGFFRVSQLEGNYYNNLSIADSCYLPGTPELPAYIVGKFTGWFLGESFDEDGTYYEMETPVVNKLVFFEVSETGITRVPSPLLEEYPDDFFNFFTCRDLNGDGLPDVAVHNQTGNVSQGGQPYSGGAPRTYVRKSDGTFAVLDTSSFPKGKEDGTQLGIYADINGDELEDLILYNTDGNIPVRVHIAETVMTLPSSQTTYRSLLQTLQSAKTSSVVKTAGTNPGADAAQIFYEQDGNLESVSSIGAGAETPVRARAVSSSSSAVEAIPTLPISGIGLLALLCSVIGARSLRPR